MLINLNFKRSKNVRHAWYAKKKKKYAKKNKSKKNQNSFKYGRKRVSRRCKSYWMNLEDDSLHQTIMIVWELKLIFSYLKSS